MARILFYTPFNQRSRDTESLMLAFRNQGHSVTSLSQQEGFQINDFLTSEGIVAISHVIEGKRTGWRYYFRHILFFVRFCRKHRIDVVYSHLEPANFVASIGQYFIKAKTYLCRHHVDEGSLYRFDRDFYYRITYRLARQIIVVSDRAKKYMIAKEHIPARKILHINLAYDFDLYNKPDPKQVVAIREQHNAKILLLEACRFTTYKRPDLALNVLKKLIDLGVNVKLILLGRGEMQDDLQRLVREWKLEQNVFMPGYVTNMLDYMEASDFFVHPSLLDSSSVAIKEAGLASLPSIVCQGVGDFDEYLVHGENAFIVHPERFVDESVAIIRNYLDNKPSARAMGAKLKKVILETFSVNSVLHQYDTINGKA